MDALPRNADPSERVRRVRVFYALWPDDAARARIAALAADVARDADGRATPERNLHVTLAFIGEVAPARIDALCAAAANSTRDVDAFDLALDVLGGAHGGELWWLAASHVPAALGELHARLAAELAAAQFRVEAREFRPHVTLARRCTRPFARAAIATIEWRVRAVTLAASTPARGGSDYAEIAQWSLR